MAVLTHCNHKTGRRCTRHVHQQWAAATQVRVYGVEIQPVQRRPVITGRSAEDWAGLETNDCFAVSPNAVGVSGVPCRDEGVHAITGDTTDAPYCAAKSAGIGGRSPCCYAGWIVNRDAYEPAMKGTAISHAPKSNIKNVAHDAQRRSLLLDLRSEVDPVV